MEAQQLADIQALEKKYGSLSQVPEDNEKLLRLRKSFSGEFHEMPITKVFGRSIRTHYTAYRYIKEELSEQGYVLTRGYYNWRCIPRNCLVNFSKGEAMFLMKKGDVKFDN